MKQRRIIESQELKAPDLPETGTNAMVNCGLLPSQKLKKKAQSGPSQPVRISHEYRQKKTPAPRLHRGRAKSRQLEKPATEEIVLALAVTCACAGCGALLALMMGCALPQPLGASYSTGGSGAHGSGLDLRASVGALHFVQEGLKRLPERVPWIACLAARKVADRRLTAFAPSRNLRLAQAAGL